MVNIAAYKTSRTEISPEVEKFMAHFKGHTTFTCQNKNGKFFSYNRPLEQAYSFLDENNKNGYNIFFTVNETSSAGRKMEHLESIRAVFADDDNPRITPYEFPLEPSLIVESSTSSKGSKYHYYWLTSTKDYKGWNRVEAGIIKNHNMDPGAKDLARILRVPGFLNHKYNPASKCTWIGGSEKVYEWEEILKHFPEEKESPKENKPVIDGTEFNMVHTMHLFATGESISPSMNSLIMHWAYRYSEDKIKDMITDLFREVSQETYDQHAKRYEDARSQIDKFIKTAKNEVAAKHGPSVVTPLISAIPEALEWDWSSMKSSEIPKELVPTYLYDAASEIGEWNGIGKEPAVISAIYMMSALLSKNVIIHETYDSLTHHCRLGVLIAMDTGASKSSIYKQMNKPFFDFEDTIQKAWEKDKNKTQAMIRTYADMIKKADANFAKSKSPSPEDIVSHATAQGKRQDIIDRLDTYKPALYSSDLTEETIVKKLFQNNGSIAIVSDDARTVIDILLGKYTKDGTAESVYINGFSGTPIIRERASGEETRIKEPALNAFLFVQPDSALKLRDSDMYVPSGLAARMPMYFYPVSGADLVHNRQRRPINNKRMDPYYQHMKNVCHRRFDNPLHIRISEAGVIRLKEFDEDFVQMLQTSWDGEYNKLNKIISTSCQVATCFAALDDPEFNRKMADVKTENNDYIIPVKYLNMGYEFMKILLSQSIVTHSNLHNEAIPRKAKSMVVKLIDLYNRDKIKEGFVLQGDFRNSFSTAIRDDLPSISEFLLEKNWLYTTTHNGTKRKLNGGFPNKLIDIGDTILHLNVRGIQRRKSMGLDNVEDQ